MSVAFNEDEALERCFRSRKMFRQMIQCFFKEFGTLLPQMRAALQAGDLTEVGRLGHRLKGTVVYLARTRWSRPRWRSSDSSVVRGSRPRRKRPCGLLQQMCEALQAGLVELRSEDWTT